MKLPVPSEDEEQSTFVEWLELKGYKFSSIPNSTYTTSWKQKAKNKRNGLRHGLPDMLVIVPVRDWPFANRTCFVEMKKVDASPSATKPHQQSWIDSLNSSDCPARVCRGAGEAIAFIEQVASGTI